MSTKSDKPLVTENDKNIIDEWYKAARFVTMDNLSEFINHVMNDYSHDYGSYVHAVAACSVATAWACGKQLSGFQASCVGLEFLMHWSYEGTKSGISIRDWDHMLYPQYEPYFDKTIPKNIWENLKKEAKNCIEDERYPRSQQVLKHMKSIAEGKVPFGYSVEGSNLS